MTNRNATTELTTYLGQLAQPGAHTDRFCASLRSEILRQAEAQGAGTIASMPEQTSSRRRSVTDAWQMRALSVVTAGVVVLAGFVGYLRLQAPTPVSAAEILHRTAMALAAADANQVVHETAAIRADQATGLRIHIDSLGLLEPDGQIARDARVDSWTQLTPDGSVDRQDVTVTDTATGTLLSRRVVTADDTRWFDAAINGTTITRGGASAWRHVISSDQPISILNIESGGQGGLLQLVNEAQHGGMGRYLGRQTADGVTADIVQITQPLNTYVSPGAEIGMVPDHVTFTLYINTQSHLIDQVAAEAASVDGTVLGTATLQVTGHEVLPLSSAPAGTFSFSSPAGACLLTVDPNNTSRSSQTGTCSGSTHL